MTRSRFRMVTHSACAVIALGMVTLSAPAQELADIKNDLKTMRDTLSRIDQRLADQKTNDLLIQQLLKDVNELRDGINRLQRELADSRNRASGVPSISGYRGPMPSTSLSVGPPAPTATVRLVNTHYIEMSAYINGMIVMVPPNSERLVSVPSGPLNYQVYQVPEPMKTRLLVPTETLTLTLFPR